MLKKCTLMLALSVVALTSFSAPANETDKDKNDRKKEIGKKEKKRCGPAFKLYNYSGNVITKFTYSGPYQTVTVNNPTFPYDIPQTSTGTYTFNFTFVAPASGAIAATDFYTGEVFTCETYEAPYASPLVFGAGCDHLYRITIYSDANAPTYCTD